MFCRSGLSIPSRSSACTESSCACTEFFRLRRRKVKKRKRHRSSHPMSKSRKNDANDCIGNPFTISENIVVHHTPQPPRYLNHTSPHSTAAYVAAYLDRSLIFRLFLFRRRTRFLCHLARIFGSSFLRIKV